MAKQKKDKRTNNDLQNTRTKDRATRTQLKPGVNTGALEGKQFLLHVQHS
jgi:hypothetical protein